MLAAMKHRQTNRRAGGFAIAALLVCSAAAAVGDEASQTIVVTATRHAMPLLAAPAAMTVVSGEQMAARGADNLFEALRGEIGLSLQGRTIGGRTALSLRGMEFRHTLFLVEGMRIGGTDGVVGHSDFEYDWVAAADIERIEVVRGPMSVLYGSEALGGVVNVITRKPGAAWAYGVLAESRLGDNSLAAMATAWLQAPAARSAIRGASRCRRPIRGARPWL